MLSQQAIKEFKDIYHKQFGKELSDQEALRKGTALLRLFKAVLKPNTSGEKYGKED